MKTEEEEEEEEEKENEAAYPSYFLLVQQKPTPVVDVLLSRLWACTRQSQSRQAFWFWSGAFIIDSDSKLQSCAEQVKLYKVRVQLNLWRCKTEGIAATLRRRVEVRAFLPSSRPDNIIAIARGSNEENVAN